MVDYRLGSTIAQSCVIAPIIFSSSKTYVAEIKTKKTTQNGVESLESGIITATVDTGISIHALPRLVGRNKIHLSLTLLQKNLTNLEEYVSGLDKLQLPTIDQRAIQNDSVLAPGEVLVLSGYEQERATRSNQGTGLARFLGFGGSTKGKTTKTRMVVLVRPAILPAVRGATVRKASRRVY